jgi:DNA-binding GntR family transcriptional regulator
MYEQEYAKLDIEFHDRMYQAAHHERLYRCWAELRPQVYVLLLSGNAMRHNFSKTAVSHHKPLLDVLRSCDEELAAAIVRRHVEDSYFLVKTGRYPRREPDDIYEVLIRQAEAQ